MEERIHMRASPFGSGWVHGFFGLALLLATSLLSAAAAPPSPAPYVYVPRANLVSVDRSYVGPQVAPIPGAGVRSFDHPNIESGGTERFEIRWYANPPGIPPGVVILFESLQERGPIVKNHILRLNEKSEGHIRSIIEIPTDEVRSAGRVTQWRVRVVWRGKLLASQTSPNWEG